MSVKVIKPGLLATIQDLGRYRFQKYGVIVSGAMDTLSLRIANLLTGNKEEEAAVEITLMGTSFLFEEEAVIAITGGDLDPKIDGRSAPMWRPIFIKAGAILEFTSCLTGCRAYLTVAGGFTIPTVMDSKSTYLRGKMGGYSGRALKAGDRLDFSKKQNSRPSYFVSSSVPFLPTGWRVPADHILQTGKLACIRVIKGNEYHRFTSEDQQLFFNRDFKITPQSDRMGYRLSGQNIKLKEPLDMISEAVSNGCIQVPADGNPILLLADRQTTGGYPRIANIIAADLPIVAQLKPGDSIRFQEVSLQEAHQIYIRQEQQIAEMKVGISLKPKAGE